MKGGNSTAGSDHVHIRAAKSHVRFAPESGHSPHEVTRSRAAALRLQMGPTSNKGLQLRYINGGQQLQ